MLALRDRLRSGDIWVEGSRQWRAIEDQLISPALFAAMRVAGPLPVAVPATAEEYLADRRALLARRLSEVAAKAAADRLEDVSIKGDEMKMSPLKAITPEEAEALADRLYGMMPAARITGLLAEVDRWTGFTTAFTHLHTGLPADDPRVVLTAVLADATNLGLTPHGRACSVTSLPPVGMGGRLALARGHLPAGARHAGQRPAWPAARRIVRGGRRVQLGRPGFPHRGTRRGRRRRQRPLWARGIGVVLHALSGRHAPYHSVAIPPSGEAAHVIDGLLYHEADMTSPSITPTAAASATMSSRSPICWVSASRPASPTLPTQALRF